MRDLERSPTQVAPSRQMRAPDQSSRSILLLLSAVAFPNVVPRSFTTSHGDVHRFVAGAIPCHTSRRTHQVLLLRLAVGVLNEHSQQLQRVDVRTGRTARAGIHLVQLRPRPAFKARHFNGVTRGEGARPRPDRTRGRPTSRWLPQVPIRLAGGKRISGTVLATDAGRIHAIHLEAQRPEQSTRRDLRVDLAVLLSVLHFHDVVGPRPRTGTSACSRSGASRETRTCRSAPRQSSERTGAAAPPQGRASACRSVATPWRVAAWRPAR